VAETIKYLNGIQSWKQIEAYCVNNWSMLRDATWKWNSTEAKPQPFNQMSNNIHTYTHTQPFYGPMDFVWDNLGEPVPEETFTHSHLSWSSIIPYLPHPSTTIHGILTVQSTCLTVFFHNLSPSFLWSASWPSTIHFIFHTFLHQIIVFFSQQMPIPSQPVSL